MRAASALPVEGLDVARGLFTSKLIGPEAIGSVLGVEFTDVLTDEERNQIARIPFAESILRSAADQGALLVLRIPRDRQGPLSIRRLYELFPSAFADKSMTEGVGYQLRSEWSVATQPFAAHPPTLGWRLVWGDPPGETRGRTYAQQEAVIGRWANSHGLTPAHVRRRTAADAVYDLVLTFRAFGIRLLENAWDWTRTETSDGAFVTVGDFGTKGLQILAYSAAVKFGNLGLCPEAHA